LVRALAPKIFKLLITNPAAVTAALVSGWGLIVAHLIDIAAGPIASRLISTQVWNGIKALGNAFAGAVATLLGQLQNPKIGDVTAAIRSGISAISNLLTLTLTMWSPDIQVTINPDHAPPSISDTGATSFGISVQPATSSERLAA
jgi:hypothetical protein